MKKFSLKPQGGSCMKMFSKSWLFIGLLATFCLAACSDDDDKSETPVFPAKQNIVCNEGETTDFTFTANTNWSLASSAIWCKFKSDATEEYVVSGTAGTHTVTVMATGDDQKVDKASVAKLELTMGGQTIVIGEVTRSAVGSELKIFDLEGNEIDKSTGLKVGYDNFAQFKVKANFRFAATNLPGWVELEGGSLVGTVDKEVKGGLKIIQDENREKYVVEANIEKDVITFADEEGKAYYKFPVYYEGMTDDKTEVKAPSTNKYYWTVSLDGKTFKQSSGGVSGTGGSTTTLKNRVPFTVKTWEDKYKIVFIESGNDGGLYIMDEEYGWMRCEGEKGNLTLIVDEFEPLPYPGMPKERIGYVLAFSQKEYDTILAKDGGLESIIVGEDIDYIYHQSNLVLQFTQKEIKSSGDDISITVVDGPTYSTIDYTSYKGDDASHFKTTYNVTSIFEIPQPTESTIIQFPNALVDITCYYFEGEQLVTERIMEPGENNITVSFKTLKKDVFFIISDELGNNLMVIARGSTLDAGGDDGQQGFVVTGGTKPKVYAGSNAESLITMHNLADIWEITGTGENVEIEMPSSAISSFKVYDLDNGTGDIDITEEVKGTEDIVWKNNPMTGTPMVGTVNVYYGGWSSIIDRTLLIVVTCEDSTIHGIVVSKGN